MRTKVLFYIVFLVLAGCASTPEQKIMNKKIHYKQAGPQVSIMCSVLLGIGTPCKDLDLALDLDKMDEQSVSKYVDENSQKVSESTRRLIDAVGMQTGMLSTVGGHGKGLFVKANLIASLLSAERPGKEALHKALDPTAFQAYRAVLWVPKTIGSREKAIEQIKSCYLAYAQTLYPEAQNLRFGNANSLSQRVYILEADGENNFYLIRPNAAFGQFSVNLREETVTFSPLFPNAPSNTEFHLIRFYLTLHVPQGGLQVGFVDEGALKDMTKSMPIGFAQLSKVGPVPVINIKGKSHFPFKEMTNRQGQP
ncbi:MAG: hypothetical protein KUG82_20420 [Pseudomonadales bacterium]|nr:hypothetical protein [Pseudomonadales bacterium]